jgi:hypothetical protein
MKISLCQNKNKDLVSEGLELGLGQAKVMVRIRLGLGKGYLFECRRCT